MYLSQDRVTQTLTQPGLEHFNGWRIHDFSGQLVPVSHHPHRKEFLLYFQTKSILFQFKAIPLVDHMSSLKVPLRLSCSPLMYLEAPEGAVSSHRTSLLQAEPPQFYEPTLTGGVLQPFDHPYSSLLDLFQQVQALLMLGTLELDEYGRWGLTRVG